MNHFSYPKWDLLIFLGVILSFVLLHERLCLVIAEGWTLFPFPYLLSTAHTGAHFVCLAFLASFIFFSGFFVAILFHALQEINSFLCQLPSQFPAFSASV